MSDPDLMRQIKTLQAQVDSLVKPEVGRWIAWTPVIDQNGTVTSTNVESQYNIRQGFAHIYCRVNITGTGTGGNPILVNGWPDVVNPDPAPNTWPVGVGTIVDTGTASYTAVLRYRIADNTIGLFYPTTGNFVGTNPSFALASGDVVYFNMYWRV